MNASFIAHLKYIENSVKAGCSGDRLREIVAKRTITLQSIFAKSASIDMNDVSLALESIASAPHFLPGQKEALQETINLKVESDEADVEHESEKTKEQHNRHLQKYLKSELTADWKCKEIDFAMKVGKGVDHLHHLGIKFPGPHLKKRLVALIMLYSGSDRLDATLARSLYLDVTRENVKRRDIRKHVPTTMKVFPLDPAEFSRLHPGLLGAPVECEFSESEIEHVMTIVSARSTNGNISSARSQPSNSQSTSSCFQSAFTPSHSPGGQPDFMNLMMQQMFMKGMANMMGMNAGSQSQSSQSSQFRDRRSSHGQRKLENATSCHRTPGPTIEPVNEDDDSASDIDEASPSPKQHADAVANDKGEVSSSEADDEIAAEIRRAKDVKKAKDIAAREKAKEKKEKEAKKKARDKEKKEQEAAKPQTKTEAELAKDATPTKAAVEMPLKKTPLKKTPSTSKSHDGESTSKGTKRKADALTAFAKNKPPKFGVGLPLLYNGCKVLEGSDRFRIVPRPGESVYDKAIPFSKTSKSEAWSKVIEYCKHPIIPKSSKNYVK